MPSPLQGLSERQREVVTHPASPLLVLGVAGSGKSTVLARRHAWLAGDGGVGAEHVLALTHSALAVDELRAGVEQQLEGGFAELHVHSVHGFCARLLRDEADEAGVDPFAVTLTAADRLALLLERVDELTLRLHDFRGNPAAMLAGVLARIDRLKEARVSAQQMADWAGALPAGDERADREREFAQVYAAHDRMLREQGALDPGDLVLSGLDLLERPHVRARVAARFRHVLVDDVQDLAYAHLRLVLALSREHRGLTAAGDPDQAILRARAAASKNLQDIAAELPDTSTLRLERSHRSPRLLLDAAQAVVAANPDRLAAPAEADAGGELRFWRCSNERAQAQAAAAEVERLLREGAAPGEVAVLVRSVRQEGQAIGAALDERAVPYSLRGGAALFERAEVKDILAWLRLLIDPGDAGAVVRALARPPVELRAIDIARCVQIARRRKLDMVAALAAATESPQIDPAARERILGFLKLHRQIAGHLDTRPDLFVHRLIDRLGLRRQQLFTAQADVVDRLRSLARIGELAAQEARRNPQATGREFARHIAAVADAGLGEIDAAARRRSRARGQRDGARRREGPRVQARAGARPSVLADAGRAPLRGRADSRRAAARGASAGHARGARARDAAPALPRDDAREREPRARLQRAHRARGAAAAVAVRRGGARRHRGRVARPRRGAVRPRRGRARRVQRAARRAAGRPAARRRDADRPAPRHRRRRQPRRRPLPRAREARRGAAPARGPERRGARSPRRAPSSPRARASSSARCSSRARSTSSC